MFFGCVDQTVGLERVGGGVDRFRLTLSSRFRSLPTPAGLAPPYK
jgi:hypothetical protein